MGNVCSCMQTRLAPKRNVSDPDSYLPSSVAVRFSTPTIKDWKEIPVVVPYSGDKKILMICTSKYLLECENGKNFDTGHQASETFVPAYHIDKCGFKFDIATPDGAPVAIEEWTFGCATGYEDKLREIQRKLKPQLDAPMKVSDVAGDLGPYAGILLPGGHGPLIEQHTFAGIGALLRVANTLALPTMALCHGPSALRAAAVGGKFPYEGYKLCVFPDKTDASNVGIYLPGKLKAEDECERKLKELGCIVQNTEMDNMTCVDRELVTGSSQVAAQTFSVACVKVLAGTYSFQVTV